MSPESSTGDPSSRKHIEPGVWPGREDRAQTQPADLEHVVVLEEQVVGGQHAGVGCGDRHLVAGVAEGGTAWMWSQWPWVSMTLRTPRCRHSSSSWSCSLAASIEEASPVALQRTTKTLLSIGPTTTL